ncbi:MAG: ATP-dependent helicase RecG [Bacteroidota bacterium]
MSRSFLSTPIEYLKGVGPQKADLLKLELKVFTYQDLIELFPFRYIDKSVVQSIKQLNFTSQNVQLRGQLTSIQVLGEGRSKRLKAILTDASGSIELVWFNHFQWLHKVIKPDAFYTVYGRVNSFNGSLSINHPEIKLYEAKDEVKGLKFEPVYPLTEKLKARFMDSKWLSQLIAQIMTHPEFHYPEYIPISVLKPLKYPSRQQAIQCMHFPKNEGEVEWAKKRIKFEEMFALAMRTEKMKAIRMMTQKGYSLPKTGELIHGFYHKHLDFELTNAQKRVIKEIRSDLVKPFPMNRLLQGDVGSGKTIVALFCMLMCVDNGMQACLMAPTEILATQHYISISDQLSDLPIRVELLTGSTSKSKRLALLNDLKSGAIQVLIGTHALIEEDVHFKQLALAIIDEQHRFGVAQRAGLWKKYPVQPHVLVMTATPIPRTLAMTIHGELDVSVIDELPKDRKPIKTLHKQEKNRSQVMAFLDQEIKKGRQVYIVYPLIEESGKLNLNDLMTGYDIVCNFFPVPKYQISILHGKMKSETKALEMKRFKDGITQILISTTVIEVGVNVPNASVMLIEDANRFGLSQLHQLRGRVGRGAEQSYCILMTKDDLNPNAKRRIDTMCASNNGFDIAQVDLELRGPGDMLGTRQSGLPEFKLLDLTTDDEVIDLAKRAAAYVLGLDPLLQSADNAGLLNYLKVKQKDDFWGQVS